MSLHNAYASWVSATSLETATSAYLASKHASHFLHKTLPLNTNYTLISVQSHQNHLVMANTLLPLSTRSLAMPGFTSFPTSLHRLSSRSLNLGLHLFKINQAAPSSTSILMKELNTPERLSVLTLHSSLTTGSRMRLPQLLLPPQTAS